MSVPFQPARPVSSNVKRHTQLRLSVPIKIPEDRPLKVCLYARFSTDEQNPLSIEDQFIFGQDCLESLGISNHRRSTQRTEGQAGP